MAYTERPKFETRVPARRNKRNKAEREHDLVEIAELYLKGLSYPKIAIAISDKRGYQITGAQVNYDIKKIRSRWVDSQLVDFSEAKSRELQKIDNLELTYWEAWEESKKKLEKVHSERVEDVSTSKRGTTVPMYTRSKVKKEEETRYGDIRFLQGIQWCIEQRCKIFGFNAPTRISMDWRKEAEEAGVDAGVLFNELVGKFIDAASVDGDGGQGSLESSPEED